MLNSELWKKQVHQGIMFQNQLAAKNGATAPLQVGARSPTHWIAPDAGKEQAASSWGVFLFFFNLVHLLVEENRWPPLHVGVSFKPKPL